MNDLDPVMPQLLSRVAPNCGVQINNVGDYPLRQRESLARAAMESIATFATVESWMLNLYLDLAGGNKTLAANMFLQLESRSARSSQLQVLIGTLDERYQKLYRAIAKLLKTRALARDRLAHGVWGISPALPDALLLADPKPLALLDPSGGDYVKKLRGIIYVYRERDFTAIINDNHELAGFGFDFRWILAKHPANRKDELYRQLCEAPALANILHRQDEPTQSQPKEAE